MKRLAGVIAAILLVGCGGGGGTPGNGPNIANLNYSPSSARLNEGDGTVLVTGTIDFTDQPIATTTNPIRFTPTDDTSPFPHPVNKS